MTETVRPTSAASQPAEQTDSEKKTKRPGWMTIGIWVGVFALLALTGWGLLQANATRPEAGQPAPDFDVEFFTGYEWENRPVANLSDLRGKVVVLNFWASWCVECRLEADMIENTWRKYADQDVVFLGVAYADVEPKSIEYLSEFNITYPNAPDLGTDIADMYEITGVPETFFIGKDGTIAHVQIGPLNQTTMDRVLTQLIAEGG